MNRSTPGLPVPHHLPKFAQVHVHCISDAAQPSHPLTPSSPSSLHLSQHQGLFQWVIGSHRMTKILQHRSFLNEYSGLISLNIDWFDLLAVQGSLRSLLQHHSSKASILWCSAFLYGPALTTIHDHWEDHSLDYMDLYQPSDVSAFQPLSRFVIPFLPRSKRLLISWLQSPSAVVLEPKERKSVTASTFSFLFALK